MEISTIYFRAGYTQQTSLLRLSGQHVFFSNALAIKCPSIPLQLSGGKKVQQVLTKPGVLEGYLCDKKWGEGFSRKRKWMKIKEYWMGMWGLDENDGIDRARKLASSLVLKPQREGGGNNVYKDDIPAFLATLLRKEREAWIAMELIVPPKGLAYLIRRRSQSIPLRSMLPSLSEGA